MLRRLRRPTCLPSRTVVPLACRNAGISSSSLCPSCGSPLPTALPTCPRCKYIAPLSPSLSYFHYFNLPTVDSPNPFAIDTRDLRRRFLQAQRVCHPDAWGQKSEKESTLAAAQSSQLNKAYQTLLSPLDRAQYILCLHGMEENETEKLQDEDFILQVMEARQEVEEASDEAQISRIKELNRARINHTTKDLERFIGEKNWQGAREATVRLKYWLGIENATKEWKHG